MQEYIKTLAGVVGVSMLVLQPLCAQKKQELLTMNTSKELVSTVDTPKIIKRTLSNGMTVLVRTEHQIPKVCIQLWYGVGSKHEQDNEKGIAHLIEHMIFKGTDKYSKTLKLSESDINTIAHKLSASINAFTSYDYTGYLFNIPSQNWPVAFEIMADCMTNASFKDEHLNSEIKAVIQELKMNKDNYTRSLIYELLTTIFPDHPYHYPVIGYKQDLWNVRGEDLRKFYKKHYCPNNATLVVVGDVEAEEVFAQAKRWFEVIPADPTCVRQDFYHNKDIIAKTVTLYRDVKQPVAITAFVLPGISTKNSAVVDMATWALGLGKGSRLYRKLVDEKKLASSFTAGSWGLFDHSLFFFIYEPRSLDDQKEIEKIIHEEINAIIKKGLTEKELQRAIKKSRMAYYDTLEDIQAQAQDLGLYYLATGDENYAFNYMNKTPQELHKGMQELLAQYFRPSVAHHGFVAPLPEEDKPALARIQAESDKQDEKILSARQRDSGVEEPSYAHKVQAKQPKTFDYPKPLTTQLSNGIKVLYHANSLTPKIDLVVELKTKWFNDSEDKQGLYNFVMRMLTEGTKKYSAAEFADELESRGMSLSAYPGGITMSMLSSDFEKGLELLMEVLTGAVFNDEQIEKVRNQILVDIKQFWDDPRSFTSQLVREKVFAGHPYHKNTLGKKEVIESITKKDLVDFYNAIMSADGAKIALVGDIKKYDVKNILDKHLGVLKKTPIADTVFPSLKAIQEQDIDYYINRDQVVLSFAGLSVDRKNKDYEKLLLFDQIFGGGVLGSMHSRLFKLREDSGLFYTISGSLTARADEQPGMIVVRTLVSLDRLKEAEQRIKDTIDHVADTISDEELSEAKSAIINALVNNFETNSSMAQSFLFLDKYQFPADYFDKRAQTLNAVTKAEVQEAVQRILTTKKLLVYRVGRVGKKK